MQQRRVQRWFEVPVGEPAGLSMGASRLTTFGGTAGLALYAQRATLQIMPLHSLGGTFTQAPLSSLHFLKAGVVPILKHSLLTDIGLSQPTLPVSH
eukprot:363731-Chlamydomonas_euryale.AAC.3